MTLLDRFRAAPRDKHPDPTIRLAHLAELPLEDRPGIAAMALDDEDPRVRRAAVAKLLDAGLLGRIAREDGDETVRSQAISMLRDLALESFEGMAEAEALDAVDALAEPRALLHIAKSAAREIVALRALSRITEPHAWGSIARHASLEAARRDALARLAERQDVAEVLAVAMNGDYKDASVAAVDLVSDDANRLEQIATRAKNKAAAKRARSILREAEEKIAAAAAEASRAAEIDAVAVFPAEPSEEQQTPHAADDAEALQAAARAHEEQLAREQAAREAEERQAAELQRRHAFLAEVAARAVTAADDGDLATARKRFGPIRKEWFELATGITVDSAVAERFAEAQAKLTHRDDEARTVEMRERKDALNRVQHLAVRVDALLARGDVTLKAAERAARDVRDVLAAMPVLPTRQDAETVQQQLKAAQARLVPKLQELRDADEWQRWANAGVQEELCARMEALKAVEDPEVIARTVRELQEQWRKAADVPRDKAEPLWHRFKAAHDAVWPRCEAHFAAEAQVRAENLAKKTALCEKAESVAESTDWIQTAELVKALQAEWKGIGAVPRGREKAIWERFRVACDRFFTRRHEDLAQRKAVWADNFAKKVALCEKVEALAESLDWEPVAGQIKQLQTEWKAVGPVKKTKSEVIWQRFRTACDKFFTRYAQRHETARAERVAAREAICTEFEALAAAEGDAPPDAVGAVRAIRARWQQELVARGVDPDRARALDERFDAAQAAMLAKWPAAFAGTDFDPEANQKRMEALVDRIEKLVKTLSGSGETQPNENLSPTDRLAAMLKEALASNTIGGKVDDGSRWRAAAEEVREAQSSWTRIGMVPDATRKPLADRFQRACRTIVEKAGDGGRPDRAAPRRDRPGKPEGRGRPEARPRRD